MTADLRAGIAFLVLVATASPVSATGFTHVLNAGRYRIDVIVENPKSGQQQTVKQVERCLGSEAIANHVVFEMLSDTPASACPKYEVCAGEFRTGFIARCTSELPSSAVGMFALEPNEFRGRIEVKNSDDKLTNVEIQYGERIGDCDPER
ncbi:MAG TPA: hypothetical protein VHC71_06345 [Hyphomicrobium sp.]|jgi:hypothetical protein|nr:hypothetical protein [Hyphomicrobium sp.]